MRRAAGIALLVAVGVAGAAAGRQTPQQDRPTVTFKVDVNFVEIDAVVTDAQGRFVRGLTKEDFELLEENVPQTISTFTAVDLPIERANPPLAREMPIESDVRSNLEPFDGRVFLLVLDDLHTDIRRTPLVRAAAKQFVRRYIGANDLVAVVHTGSAARSGQDFTSSQARLTAAIDRFAGKKLPSIAQARLDDYYRQRGDAPPVAGSSVTIDAKDEYEQVRAHHARNMLQSLRAAAEFMSHVHGRRKAVVWFGEGIDMMTDDVMRAKNASLVLSEMRDTTAAAARAGVSFYAVDARGVGAGLDEALSIGALPDDPTANVGPTAFLNEVRRAQDFLRTMSEETGGFAIINQNNLNAAFERVVRENSAYYLLGYYPSNERRDGKLRTVQVRVKRPGLQVRSRGGYTAPKGTPPAPSAIGKDTGASAEVKAALQSPLPVNGLGLTMTAVPVMGPKRTAIAIVVEIDPGRLSFAEKNGMWSEEVELVVLPIDASGKPHPGGRDQLPMNLSPANYERVRAAGVRATRTLELSAGRYQLRVAARARNSGAVGSLLYDLDVPDFTQPPLAISGLALTSHTAAQMPTPAPPKDFLTLVAAVPTARREFARSDTLQLIAEVYDNRAATPHRVTITTQVLGDDGRGVVRATAERRSDEIQGRGGAYDHVVNIPLAKFPPGRYVLRLEATSTLREMPAVSREIEFRVR